MSIADEIQRIKTNIANAYLKCSDMGAELPTQQNSENLATCINTISNTTSEKLTKYGASVDAFLGEIDENGTLQIPQSGQYLVFDGVQTIAESALTYRFCVSNSGISNINNITGVSFPDLETIKPYNALEKSFYNQANLKEVLLPKLKNITNNHCFNEAFAYCRNLEKVSMPALKEIPAGTYGNAFYRAFYCCLNLSDLDLSNLISVSGSQTFGYAFGYCTNLTEINLSNLTTVNGANVLYNMFENSGVINVTFDKLSTVNGSRAMGNMFSNCKNLKSLSFPSLNSNSFNDNNNIFERMLYNVDGCTVHFPFAIKKVIGDWEDVISGFDGDNTIILFDLHSVYLNFISNKQNITIYVNEEDFSGTSGYAVSGDVKYAIYSPDDKIVITGILNDLEDDSIVDVNLDFTQSANKIKLSTAVSGLNVSFYVDNLEIPAVEESGGNYILNIIGNNKEIKYYINGGDSYSDAEGTITLTGENLTQNIEIHAVTLKTFVRPNLTENGELGGNSFAAASTGEVSSYYGVFKVFNGDETDYLWASEEINTITFYNPKPLRVSSLVIKYYSSSSTYQPASITVQGSNNNIDWTDLANFEYETSISRTLNINSPRFYKYYRLVMPEKSVYLRICEITINASYKE